MNNSETNLSSPLQKLMNTNDNLISNIISNTNITQSTLINKVSILYSQLLIVLQQFIPTFFNFMNEYMSKFASQDRKFVTLAKQIDEYDKKVTNVTQLMKEALLGVEENDKKITEFTTLMNKVLAERQTNTPMSKELQYSMYSGGNKTRKQRKYKRKISK